jgi:hypothetical protein
MLPGYVFPNGYLERDVGLHGITFDYHVVNVWDLAKFLLQYKESGIVMDAELSDRCVELIDRGIDCAVRSSYWCYLVASMRQSSVAIVRKASVKPQRGNVRH